jgi:hypothetical protein
MKIYDIQATDEDEPLNTTVLESEEDNRQSMKSVLKEIRNLLLTKFKKNKKTRRKSGKHSFTSFNKNQMNSFLKLKLLEQIKNLIYLCSD